MSKVCMVRHEGGSRVLSVSKVIPVDWIAVDMTIVKQGKAFIIIRVEKVK